MFKNVLLATDGSANAKRAADVATNLAATYGARLTLVTVMSPAMMLDDVEAMPQARRLPRTAKDEIKRIRRMTAQSQATSASDLDISTYIPALPTLTRALGETILDGVENAARRSKIKASRINRVVVNGDAATQILKQATKAKADLIVIGTRGLGNLRGLLIGSVSNKVIHNAKCPTLIVK